MYAHAIRHSAVIAVTGIGLFLGGSISRYVAASPAVLYAAGELRMMLGDRQGGLELVGRAEAARNNGKPAAQPAVKDGSRPTSAPSEICSEKKTPLRQSRVTSEPEPQLVAAALPPLPPQAIAPQLSALERVGFDSLGRRWPDVNNKRVRIDVSNVMSSAQLRELRHVQHRVHDGKLKPTVIVREVRRNLERQNGPLMGGIMEREMITAPEPPALDQ